MDLMPEQLSLPGLDGAELPFKADVVPIRSGRLMGYSLFLAIVPEPEAAQRLTRVASVLRGRHRLGGKLLAADRLHITLIAIDGFVDTIPQAVVDAAVAASAGVICPSIPIVFDHVLSYPESSAFVLRCNSDGDAAIARLRQSLAVALRRAGLQPDASRTPHMTMLYDPRHVAQQAIEPICWTATRFALILSHVGLGHHQWVAQWPLDTRPGSSA
jgi:2'-5' RNA ligase